VLFFIPFFSSEFFLQDYYTIQEGEQFFIIFFLIHVGVQSLLRPDLTLWGYLGFFDYMRYVFMHSISFLVMSFLIIFAKDGEGIIGHLALFQALLFIIHTFPRFLYQSYLKRHVFFHYFQKHHLPHLVITTGEHLSLFLKKHPAHRNMFLCTKQHNHLKRLYNLTIIDSLDNVYEVILFLKDRSKETVDISILYDDFKKEDFDHIKKIFEKKNLAFNKVTF
jgi:FlaA1/EpsC-like NDP-sugar epimerase